LALVRPRTQLLAPHAGFFLAARVAVYESRCRGGGGAQHWVTGSKLERITLPAYLPYP
jgi:hypothetical protein